MFFWDVLVKGSGQVNAYIGIHLKSSAKFISKHLQNIILVLRPYAFVIHYFSDVIFSFPYHCRYLEICSVFIAESNPILMCTLSPVNLLLHCWFLNPIVDGFFLHPELIITEPIIKSFWICCKSMNKLSSLRFMFFFLTWFQFLIAHWSDCVFLISW